MNDGGLIAGCLSKPRTAEASDKPACRQHSRIGRAMEATLARNRQEQKDRAEAAFKKKEQQAREGDKARAEYETAARAEAAKTARLKALRLAKEESDRRAVSPTNAKRRYRSNKLTSTNDE
jgi:hypothetical protein